MSASVATHPMDLSGKVAIVTGGNRGIGLGMVNGLSAAGCQVAVWARDRRRNEKAVEACAGRPGEVAAFACDVVNPMDVDQALEQTVARFGRIDGVFANAGIGGGGRTPFVEQTDDDWQRMLQVNIVGTRRTLSPILRRMIAQSSGGRIVITSSVAATLGTAYNEHYAATKAGLVAIARAIAVEFGRFGITANAILPGYVETEMIDNLLGNDKFRERMKPRLPLGRLGLGDDLAGIAIYLMSSLSSYHTGDSITVDGGFSIS
jgi:NAD(P)-dependent dehydrogenase (short-subunit alcohol dehydrogenase family)